MRRAVLLAVMSLSAVSLAACGRDDTPEGRDQDAERWIVHNYRNGQ